MSKSRPSYADLQAEIERLRREKDNVAREFRSELEEVIRAQASIELVGRLISEIPPSIFSSPDRGKELLSDLDGACYQVKRAINETWYGMGLREGKKRPDIALAEWLNDEVKKQNREAEKKSD